ncbi:coiled-coil domain-containing protein 124 [Dorcoceras hygrometricum]|uniref:Coiled-coil domain-containing protein 124 n=1 Tax=Dorcoceras hygrometricum TaxID=472368 RepID=A0A2Z7D3W2_9LAMI|nr:coiled-coil domain-containing protein 124 [Dorcoceras hygrometricum]
MERNHLPKAAKEQKNYGSTIAKTLEHCNNFVLLNSATPVPKLVSIEHSREYELSATNLAPNGGVKRRQSRVIGDEDKKYQIRNTLSVDRHLVKSPDPSYSSCQSHTSPDLIAKTEVPQFWH